MNGVDGDTITVEVKGFRQVATFIAPSATSQTNPLEGSN